MPSVQVIRLKEVKEKRDLKILNEHGQKLHEPYMEVKKGYGYLGVILYDDVEKKIQCHICGQLFPRLSNHIRAHKISGADYKEKFGLNKTTPLQIKELSEQQSARSAFMYRLHPQLGHSP